MKAARDVAHNVAKMSGVRIVGATIESKDEPIAACHAKARPAPTLGIDTLNDEIPARVADANWLCHP